MRASLLRVAWFAFGAAVCVRRRGSFPHVVRADSSADPGSSSAAPHTPQRQRSLTSSCQRARANLHATRAATSRSCSASNPKDCPGGPLRGRSSDVVALNNVGHVGVGCPANDATAAVRRLRGRARRRAGALERRHGGFAAQRSKAVASTPRHSDAPVSVAWKLSLPFWPLVGRYDSKDPRFGWPIAAAAR